MLAGAAAGWVQDVHFGGPRARALRAHQGAGGLRGGRWRARASSSPSRGARVLVLFAGHGRWTRCIFDRLAAVFDVAALRPRARRPARARGVNALVGVPALRAVDRRAAPRRGAAVRIYEDLRGLQRRAGASSRRSWWPCMVLLVVLLLAPAGRARHATSASWPRTTASAPCPSPRRAARSSTATAGSWPRTALLQRGAHHRAHATTCDESADAPGARSSHIDAGGGPRAAGHAAGPRFRSVVVKADATRGGRGHGRGAPARAAGGQRGGGAAALLSAGRGAAHVPRATWARSPSGSSSSRGVRGHRGRGPWWARPGSSSQYNRELMGKDGLRRIDREQPRGGGRRRPSASRRWTGPAATLTLDLDLQTGVGGGDGGPVGQRGRPRPRDRRDPGLTSRRPPTTRTRSPTGIEPADWGAPQQATPRSRS